MVTFPISNMARFITVFHCTTIVCIAYLVLKLDFVDPAEDTPCTFPSGNIACKVSNYTNVDCSWRELVCIPPLRHKVSLDLLDLSNNTLTHLSRGSFSGFYNLQTLYLSDNKISAINDDAFAGLNKLRTLDLSRNLIDIIPDNVFRGLNLLQTLSLLSNSRLRILPDSYAFGQLHNFTNLDLSYVHSIRLSNKTFSGLTKLKTLDLLRNKVHSPDSPFRDLLSLQTLHIHFSTVNVPPTMFDGINRTLKFLSIGLDDTTVTTESPFAQLLPLNYLELHFFTTNFNEALFCGLSNLKYLTLIVKFPLMIPFSPLMSLTNLSLKYALISGDHYSPDSRVYLQSLNSLRGYCTSYQKLACFVLYLRIINICLRNNKCIL